MAGNNPPEGLSDDFFEQILAVPESYAVSEPSGYVRDVGCMPIGLQLGSGSGHGSSGSVIGGGFRGINGIGIGMGMDLPLGMNLEQGFLRQNHNRFRNDFEGSNSNNISHNNSNTLSSSAIIARDSVHMSNLFPAFGHLQNQSLRLRPRPLPPRQPPQLQQQFHNQHTTGSVAAAPQPPAIRPRARARRGQATDPHSIAERVRRERIAERMRALQELVPSCNKTDRGAMLDEIVDYVKFLRLQVKVLSMSRLGGAGAVAQLVADVPLSSVERIESGSNEPAWDKWSSDGTEQEVAKLMEENVGAAMQFLQSKALCIMPVSLSSAIFRTRQSDTSMVVKPESNNSS